jgi:hypothetical protein
LKGMQQKIDGGQEQMITKMDVWLAEMRAWRKETMASQEATDACLESKEPTSLESIAVH